VDPRARGQAGREAGREVRRGLQEVGNRIEAFWGGLALGFAIAVSPGPISFLWLRRTLERGWWAGLSSGLGVAVADTTYAALGAFGAAAVSAVLLGQERWIRLAGGAALVLLGLRSLLAKSGATPPRERAAAADFGSMLVLTLANPQTIVLYAAAFAGLGLKPAPGTAALLVAGVFCGSEAWWLLAGAGVTAVRRRVGERVTAALRVLSGLAVAAFGLALLLRPPA
jgi:putative LysE/RhtB family amino acid efflux pump